MKDKKLNKDMNKLFDNMISSDFSAITEKISSGKGEILDMKKEINNEIKNKKEKVKSKINLRDWIWLPSVGAAVLALFVAVIIPSQSELTTVTIDVNPGIELQVNNKDEVKEITALNEDAKKIVESVDVKNDNIKTATDEIMQSMIDNKYISTEANSVLVTVDEASKEAERIKNEFTNSIESYLTSKDINPSIIGQLVTSSEELQKLATENNISLGKAEIINKLIAVNPEYTFAELAKLNTLDLSLLVDAKEDILEDLEILGNISNGSYVGLEQATSAVLATLGVTQADLSELETEIDHDDNKMVYEVEFKYNNKEYEYKIDALTGTILSRDIDGIDSTDIEDEIDDKDDDNDDMDDDQDDDNDDMDDKDDDNDDMDDDQDDDNDDNDDMDDDIDDQDDDDDNDD